MSPDHYSNLAGEHFLVNDDQHSDQDQPEPEAVADTPETTQDSGADAETETEAEAGPNLEELQAKADQNWDLYLRSVAELENVRRRSTRELENAHKFAVERFAKEMIGVKDSLEMGLDAGKGDDATLEALVQGTEMTLKMLGQGLEKFQVTEVDPLGEPFDPEFHEALSMQPDPNAEPNTVLLVVQKGYRLHDRLLRPARVIVAQAVEANST